MNGELALAVFIDLTLHRFQNDDTFRRRLLAESARFANRQKPLTGGRLAAA